VRAPACGSAWRSGRVERGGEVPTGGGQRGRRGNGRYRPIHGGRGGRGVDMWAAATVSGGGTG
jgi:hypothetical protein